MDLIRKLLLQIEEKDDGSGRQVHIELPDWNDAQLADHLFQLHERGLIDGIDASTLAARAFLPLRLTSSGHDFLDSVRDPEIWQKTKDSASAAGGFTVELLGEIAKGLVKTKIKQHTGIDI